MFCSFIPRYIDSYQAGNVYRTGHRIHNISVAGDKMSFTFTMTNVTDAGATGETSAGVIMAAMNKLFLLSVAAAGVLLCLY